MSDIINRESLVKKKSKVVILGGGIGALATATELMRLGDYDITVIERNSELGGQARSGKNSDGNHTEYCWHAIGSGYNNFLNLLNEITDKNGYKLISHIKPIHNYIYAGKDNTYHELYSAFLTDPIKFEDGFTGLYGRKLTFKEKMQLLWLQFTSTNMCDERVVSLDSVKWADYINTFSPEVRRWLLDSTSIYFGMDYAQLSTHFMIHLGRQNNRCSLLDPLYNFYSLDAPMNEVLFDNWQRYLEERGVKFMLNTNIISIETNLKSGQYPLSDMCIHEEAVKHLHEDVYLETKITHIFVEEFNKKDDITDIQLVFGDIFINSLSVESIAELYPKTNIPSIIFETEIGNVKRDNDIQYDDSDEVESEFSTVNESSIYSIYNNLDYVLNSRNSDQFKESGKIVYQNKFMELADKGYQLQTQILYYIPYRLQLPYMGPSIYILYDTKWFLMMRLEGDLWNISTDLLSVGIGMWDVKGENGKTAIECSREEIAEECWKQISLTQHNLKLADTLMPKWDIWFSYDTNDKSNYSINTYEPKFSNNINTLKIRPSSKDDSIKNLFHATAYNITQKNVFNMEGACEAGRTTAQIIHYGELKDKKIIEEYSKPSLFTRICRKIDKCIFKFCKFISKYINYFSK